MWAQPLKKRLGLRQVSPVFLPWNVFQMGMHTRVIRGLSTWTRASFLPVHRRSHGQREMSRGHRWARFKNPVLEKSSVWDGDSDANLRRPLRGWAGQLSAYKFPMIAGAFWNEVLLMVLFPVSFRLSGCCSFFPCWRFQRDSVCALECFSFVSQKEGYHMLGVILLETKCGSQ